MSNIFVKLIVVIMFFILWNASGCNQPLQNQSASLDDPNKLDRMIMLIHKYHDPPHGRAECNISDIYMERRRKKILGDEVIPYLKDYIKNNPEEANWIYLWLAWAEESLPSHNDEKAIYYYTQVKQFPPIAVWALLGLIMCTPREGGEELKTKMVQYAKELSEQLPLSAEAWRLHQLSEMSPVEDYNAVGWSGELLPGKAHQAHREYRYRHPPLPEGSGRKHAEELVKLAQEAEQEGKLDQAIQYYYNAGYGCLIDIYFDYIRVKPIEGNESNETLIIDKFEKYINYFGFAIVKLLRCYEKKVNLLKQTLRDKTKLKGHELTKTINEIIELYKQMIFYYQFRLKGEVVYRVETEKAKSYLIKIAELRKEIHSLRAAKQQKENQSTPK